MLVSETGEAPPPLPPAPGCPPSPSTSSSSSEGSASRWTSAAPVEGRSWSARAVLVGLAVGLVICFSNMYFGLQTGKRQPRQPDHVVMLTRTLRLGLDDEFTGNSK